MSKKPKTGRGKIQEPDSESGKVFRKYIEEHNIPNPPIEHFDLPVLDEIRPVRSIDYENLPNPDDYLYYRSLYVASPDAEFGKKKKSVRKNNRKK